MTIGAPDHVRLADNAHSRYTWRWNLAASIIAVDGITYTLIDKDFEGILISFTSLCKYKSTRYRLYVDDIMIQELRPEIIWDSHHFHHAAGGFDITGLNRYDLINDEFALWWQSHFMCYVKKSVKVEVWQNSGGPVQVLYPMIYYLER